MVGRRDIATEALDAATARFMSGKPLDMNQLAAELQIDRTTLFRHAGNRDTLTGNVLERLTRRSWARALRECPGTGRERVLAIAMHHLVNTVEAPYFHDFLNREPQKALSMLTTAKGPVHHTLVSLTTDLLVDEIGAEVAPGLKAGDLAYLMVRMGESFAYSNLITGSYVDTSKARLAHSLLLSLPVR